MEQNNQIEETKVKEQNKDNNSAEENNLSDDENDDVYNKEDLQCRFYRREWPEKDELVAVSIPKFTSKLFSLCDFFTIRLKSQM